VRHVLSYPEEELSRLGGDSLGVLVLAGGSVKHARDHACLR
jgi:hypothetical protein